MIPKSPTSSKIFPIENRFFNFCVGKTVNGKSPEVSVIFSIDPLVNLEHFDTNFMGAADCGYIVSTEKPAKKWILRG